MNFIHESTMKYPDGSIEIDIIMNKKRYTYLISSEFMANQFERLYRKQRYGKALAILNGERDKYLPPFTPLYKTYFPQYINRNLSTDLKQPHLTFHDGG